MAAAVLPLQAVVCLRKAGGCMAVLVANCPRCGAANMTFDVLGTVFVRQEYGWQRWFETFSVCRNCRRPTDFLISQRESRFNETPEAEAPEKYKGSLNAFFEVDRFISLIDKAKVRAPEHTPPNVQAIFDEAASSVAVGNWNAAGAMFRLAIGLATEPLLPKEPVPGLTRRKRRDLGPRLEWLFDGRYLPEELRELSTCIREDGNDAAHDGTLKKADAGDLLDFTVALFERLYTEPERLKFAKARRDERRKPEMR
jgi:Domain of unknown function (DUF4145)